MRCATLFLFTDFFKERHDSNDKICGRAGILYKYISEKDVSRYVLVSFYVVSDSNDFGMYVAVFIPILENPKFFGKKKCMGFSRGGICATIKKIQGGTHVCDILSTSVI